MSVWTGGIFPVVVPGPVTVVQIHRLTVVEYSSTGLQGVHSRRL